jgi:heme A synthase
MSTELAEQRVRRLGWVLAFYNGLVILFGAWVRVTGSGAGCGEHWPTCHGEIIPRTPSAQTLVEFTHRVTSGLDGLLLLGLAILVARTISRSSTRRWTVVAVLFLVLEALLGRALVDLKLVADDTSGARVVVVGLHLVNTLLLSFAIAMIPLSLTSRGAPLAPHAGSRRGVLAAALAFCVACSTGAVTALGDTLFPVIAGAFGETLARFTAADAHFLERIRWVHPVLAVGIAGGLWTWAGRIKAAPPNALGRRAAAGLQHGMLLQVLVGYVNIAMSAPSWMQIVHLAVALVVWVPVVALYRAYEEGEG